MPSSADMINYGGNDVASLQVTTGLYPSTSTPIDIRESVKNRSWLTRHQPVGLKLFPGLKIHIQDSNETATVIRMITGRTGAYWDDWLFDITLDEFHDAVDHCREIDPVKYRDILPGVYTLENLLNYLFIRGESYVPNKHTVTLTYKFGTNGYKYVDNQGFQQVSANEDYKTVSYQVTDGTTYTISLEPAEGWECKNGQQTITQIVVENVTEDRTITVSMMPKYYTVTASTNPANTEGLSISVTSPETGSTYKFGESCTVTINLTTPYYSFDHYAKNGVDVGQGGQGNTHPYTFQVRNATTIVAYFNTQEVTHTISATVSPTGKGTVNGSESWSSTQAEGSTVTIVAAPTFDSGGHSKTRFLKWTEDDVDRGNNPTLSVTVAAGSTDRSFVAHFEDMEYTVSAYSTPDNVGTITGTGTFRYGQTTELSISGYNTNQYTFNGWYLNNNRVSTSTTFTTEQIVGDVTYEARFTTNGQISISVKIDNNAHTDCSARIKNTSTGGEWKTSTSTTPVTEQFYPGENGMLSAIAGSNYNFQKWTGPNGFESSNTEVELTNITGSNRTYTANFIGKDRTITVSANPSNGGTVTGGGTYHHGESCTVTATANTGYTFTNWTENGTVVSTNSTYTFTVTGNRTLVANFSTDTYTISTSSSPTAGGSTNGGGTYAHGQSCTVTATANAGYTFSKWTENGSQVSTSASYTFTVTGSRTLVAVFTQNNYTISVSADPSNGGIVAGGGSNYHYGDSCTVTATANTGYTFTNWTEGGSQASTSASYTFTVTGNRTLVANFSSQQLSLRVEVEPTGEGNDVKKSGDTASYVGNHTVNYNTTLNLVAAPATASGYTFKKWMIKYGTGEYSDYGSTNTSESFTITQNTYIKAVFAMGSHSVTLTNNTSGSGRFIKANGDPESSPVTVDHGSSYIVRFRRNAGYIPTIKVDNTEVAATQSGDTFSYEIANITSDKAVVVTCSRPKYTLTLSKNPNNGGTVTESGSSSYYGGDSVTVNATAASGYTFTCWKDGGGNVVSSDASYTFTMPYSSYSLTAYFTAINYLNVYAWPVYGSSDSYYIDLTQLTASDIKSKPKVSVQETNTDKAYIVTVPKNTAAAYRVARIVAALPMAFNHNTPLPQGPTRGQDSFFMCPSISSPTSAGDWSTTTITIDGTQYILVQSVKKSVYNGNFEFIFGKVGSGDSLTDVYNRSLTIDISQMT